MAVKFDKEMLLKHRFWVMLGVSVVLTLVGIIILEASGPSGRDKLLQSLKTDGSTKGSESLATINYRQKNAEIARKNETEVWKNAYDPQADLYLWPAAVEEKYDFANGYFANEIKILKPADANPKLAWKDAVKSWPADNPFLMHGMFVQKLEDWFQIKDRNGDIKKFFLTRRSEKILTEDGKAVPVAELAKLAPKKMLAVGYQRGKYFADPLTALESRLFKDSYRDQIAPLLESVDPLDDKLNGVVQLKGWRYKKDTLPHESVQDYRFLRYVTADWGKLDVGKLIDKEAWIAQEDLWIQKEIYRLIRSANDSVSNFTPLGPVPLPAKPTPFTGKPEKRNQAYAFRNSYFDLELTLDKEDNLSFKIKNRLARKQSIDLSFRVLLNSAKGQKEEIIKISGLPLMPAGSKDNGPKDRDYHVPTEPIPKGKEERTGIYSVQQVLSWQTAAIKRIDQISIGSAAADDVSHSQRTFPVGLRPFDDKDIVAKVDAKGPKAGPGIPKRPGPGLPKGKKIDTPVVVPAGPGGLQMGLWLDRYVEVTEQARRLPVAVVLIVDQEHVDRVLTSFNNSKLRFLETQVLLNQYAGSLQPPAVEDKAAPGPERPVFNPFGPKGPIGPAPPVQPAGGGGGDLETNMEMVIYGIVTLYQKYPPRPAMAPLEK